ncbi:MAG: hypothetical protein AB1609_17345 [Bacillota bacterium]
MFPNPAAAQRLVEAVLRGQHEEDGAARR